MPMKTNQHLITKSLEIDLNRLQKEANKKRINKEELERKIDKSKN